MAIGEQQQGVYTQSLMAFEDAFGKDPADLSSRAILLPFNSNGQSKQHRSGNDYRQT